jgi:hypothetical protein
MPWRKQPTPREINQHLWAATGYCYVTLPDGRRFRVSRVRTMRGVLKGRVITGSGSEKFWEAIPPDAVIELT